MFSDKDIFFSNIKLEKEEESMHWCTCIIKCSIPDCWYLKLKKNTVIGDFIVNFLNLHEKFIINNHLWYMDLEDSPAFRL